MSDRSKDWLAQAERNLAQAEDSASADRHEWACFAAQQAAEMAVKDVYLRHGQDAWGHLVRRLLEELRKLIEVPGDLVEAAKVLDLHYVPARYPNGRVERTPGENYGPIHSQEAIRYARQIVEFCRVQLAGAG